MNDSTNTIPITMPEAAAHVYIVILTGRFALPEVFSPVLRGTAPIHEPGEKILIAGIFYPPAFHDA